MQCAKAFTGFLFWNKQREHFLLNFTKQLLFEKVNFAPVISNEKWKNDKKWRDNSKISKYVSSTINNDNNCVTGYEVSGLRQIYFRLKAVWKKHLPNQIGTIFNLPAKQHSWFGPHLIQLGDIDCAGYQKTLNGSHLLLQWWKMFMLKTTWLLLLYYCNSHPSIHPYI